MWHTWTSLIWALCVSASWAWRSECEIEGVDVKVTVHGTEGVTSHGWVLKQEAKPLMHLQGHCMSVLAVSRHFLTPVAHSVRTCRAAYIDTVDLASIDNLAEIAAGVDVIFTDSLVHVPFAGRALNSVCLCASGITLECISGFAAVRGFEDEMDRFCI
eukprot:4491403-Amphidinium_carterae.1